MKIRDFFTSKYCTSKKYCKSCLTSFEWRSSIIKSFRMSVDDYECPRGITIETLPKESLAFSSSYMRLKDCINLGKIISEIKRKCCGGKDTITRRYDCCIVGNISKNDCKICKHYEEIK